MDETMVTLVSETPQTYKGRKLAIGDEFAASKEDADDMITMRWARKVDDTKQKRTYQRRDMVAEK